MCVFACFFQRKRNPDLSKDENDCPKPKKAKICCETIHQESSKQPQKVQQRSLSQKFSEDSRKLG